MTSGQYMEWQSENRGTFGNVTNDKSINS